MYERTYIVVAWEVSDAEADHDRREERGGRRPRASALGRHNRGGALRTRPGAGRPALAEGHRRATQGRRPEARPGPQEGAGGAEGTGLMKGAAGRAPAALRRCG